MIVSLSTTQYLFVPFYATSFLTLFSSFKCLRVFTCWVSISLLADTCLVYYCWCYFLMRAKVRELTDLPTDRMGQTVYIHHVCVCVHVHSFTLEMDLHSWCRLLSIICIDLPNNGLICFLHVEWKRDRFVVANFHSDKCNFSTFKWMRLRCGKYVRMFLSFSSLFFSF